MNCNNRKNCLIRNGNVVMQCHFLQRKERGKKKNLVKSLLQPKNEIALMVKQFSSLANWSSCIKVLHWRSYIVFCCYIILGLILYPISQKSQDCMSKNMLKNLERIYYFIINTLTMLGTEGSSKTFLIFTHLNSFLQSLLMEE